MKQAVLDMRLKVHATLDSFNKGGNEELIDRLYLLQTDLQSELQSKPDLSSQFIYLWGGSGAGKSHLLHALCQHSNLGQHKVVYIPLTMQELSPEYLDGLEQIDLICIDDIHSIGGQTQWEDALFHLYNRVRDQGHCMVVTGNAAPSQLTLKLNDLKSRMTWGLTYQVHELDDDGKALAIKAQANRLGFDLPDNVARYLISRCPRDSHTLFSVLDKIDKVSLVEQRKITIPFVKQLI
jgi:DnaA family protein